MKNACYNIPHYQNLFNDLDLNFHSIKCKNDIEKLPALSKEQVKKYYDKIILPSFCSISYKLIEQKISGSAGKLIIV